MESVTYRTTPNASAGFPTVTYCTKNKSTPKSVTSLILNHAALPKELHQKENRKQKSVGETRICALRETGLNQIAAFG